MFRIGHSTIELAIQDDGFQKHVQRPRKKWRVGGTMSGTMGGVKRVTGLADPDIPL